MKHDPYRVALELREQLASEERRLSFFFWCRNVHGRWNSWDRRIDE